MAHIVTSVTIDRPPADVFAYLADVSKHGDWQESVAGVSVKTEGPTGTGTRVVHERRIGKGSRTMSTTTEVTDYDAPRLFGFRTADDGPIHVVGQQRVEPVDGGSRVTLDMEMTGRGVRGMLLLPMVRRQASRQVVTDHQRLKEILESATAAQPQH
jgi:uncharacterized protein YndB with AHSA1/START domain